MIIIGNDVVDLRSPRSRDKHTSERFIQRVFTEEEAALIRDSRAPDRTLWTLWAAKETAYKVATKLLGTPPVFEHRAFVCLPFQGDSAGLWGEVQWGEVRVHLADDSGEGWIHLTGWDAREGPPPYISPAVHRHDRWATEQRLDPHTGWQSFLGKHFTREEADPIHSVPSALVRIAARRAAGELLGVEEGRLQLICGEGAMGRRPPRLILDGRPAPVDVSLSHHGELMAWVVGPPPGDQSA